jgi:N-acetylmuramoyl-L-alanine amidase
MTTCCALRAVFCLMLLAAATPPVAATELRSPAPQVDLQKGELSLLARVVQRESENQPAVGQRAVAWTAINRLCAGIYGKTLKSILLARHQYARPKPLRPDSPAYQAALRAATMAVEGTLPDDSKGSTHFHACNMKRRPAWAARFTPTVKIASHCFYKRKH